MEEVPLEDLNAPATAPPVDLTLERASKEDCGAWQVAYENLMATSLARVHALLLSRKWTLQKTVDHIQLFVQPPAYAYYSIKAVALFPPPFRAERLVYVMRDHAPETRMRWDQECENVKEWESFSQGSIHIVQCECVPTTPLVWPRFALGALLVNYNSQTGVHTLVFHTTQHRYHNASPTGKVSVKALVGATVRTLDDGTCELTLVANVNLGDSLPAALAEQWIDAHVFKRLLLWETTVKNWNLFYQK